MLEAERRQVLWGSVSTGAKQGESSTVHISGCWILPRCGPFSFGGRFETYKPFVYLIFQFFFYRGKPRMTEIEDTGAHL
jgi:hypothetical protein